MENKTFLVDIRFFDNSCEYRLVETNNEDDIFEIVCNYFKSKEKSPISTTWLTTIDDNFNEVIK